MAVAKLKEESKVKVINNTTGSLSFYDCDDKKHLFPRKKSFKELDMKKIEALYNASPNLIDHGHIIFSDKRVYEYLGIAEEFYSKLFSLDEIEELIENSSDVELKEKIEDAPKAIKEAVAKVAKEKGIDSKKKIKAIKEVTGFDLEDHDEE